jgi:lipopolysaccharide biosynthesis regulator YciM
VLGPDHESTLSALHSLGILYAKMGRVDEAVAMHQRVLGENTRAWTLVAACALADLDELKGHVNREISSYSQRSES